MIDWALIEGFDWDGGNERKSVAKHGVGRDEAEAAFVDPNMLVLDDEKHSGQERRYVAYGKTGTERALAVSFTLRKSGTLVRIISARNMSRRERVRYDEEAEA